MNLILIYNVIIFIRKIVEFILVDCSIYNGMLFKFCIKIVVYVCFFK